MKRFGSEVTLIPGETSLVPFAVPSQQKEELKFLGCWNYRKKTYMGAGCAWKSEGMLLCIIHTPYALIPRTSQGRLLSIFYCCVNANLFWGQDVALCSYSQGWVRQVLPGAASGSSHSRNWERNLDHLIENPMRRHGWCCPTSADIFKFSRMVEN